MKTRNASPSFLKKCYALFRGLLDKRTPWLAKITGLVVLAYVILPFDFIPDAIPVLGWLDDATVAAIGIFIISKLVPKEVLGEYLNEKEDPTKSIKN
jgi:uncharacterized membrane protein YkvA (DUF1232 family)